MFINEVCCSDYLILFFRRWRGIKIAEHTGTLIGFVEIWNPQGDNTPNKIKTALLKGLSKGMKSRAKVGSGMFEAAHHQFDEDRKVIIIPIFCTDPSPQSQEFAATITENVCENSYSRLVTKMEFRSVKLDEGVTESEHYAFRQLLEDVESSKAVVDSVMQDLDEREAELSSRESRLKDLEQRAESLSAERTEFERERDRFYDEKSDHFAELTRLREQAKTGDDRLQDKYAKIEDEAEDLRKQVEGLKHNLKQKEEALRTKQQQITELEKKKGDRALRREIHDKEEELKTLKAEVANLSTKLSEAQDSRSQEPKQDDTVGRSQKTFYERERAGLQKKIEILENRVGRLTTQLKGGRRPAGRMYDSAIELIRAYTPRLLELAEALVTTRLDLDSESAKAEVTTGLGKLEITSLMRYKGLEDPVEILTQFEKDCSGKDSDIKDVLRKLYDESHEEEHKEYEDKAAEAAGLKAALAKILPSEDEINSASESESEQQRRVADTVKSKLSEPITEATRIVNTYQSKREAAVQHDAEILEKCIELNSLLKQRKSCLEDVQSKVNDYSYLPIAFHLSESDEGYVVRVVLPIDEEYAKQFGGHKRSPEADALFHIYNSVFGQMVFGGEDQPRHDWLKLIKGEGRMTFLRGDKLDVSLLCYDFLITDTETKSLAFAQRRMEEMIDSLYEGFEMTGLPELGFRLDMLSYVEEESRREEHSTYTEDLTDVERDIYSLVLEHGGTISASHLITELNRRSIELNDYERRRAINTLKDKEMIYSTGSSRHTKYHAKDNNGGQAQEAESIDEVVEQGSETAEEGKGTQEQVHEDEGTEQVDNSVGETQMNETQKVFLRIIRQCNEEHGGEYAKINYILTALKNAGVIVSKGKRRYAIDQLKQAGHLLQKGNRKGTAYLYVSGLEDEDGQQSEVDS